MGEPPSTPCSALLEALLEEGMLGDGLMPQQGALPQQKPGRLHGNPALLHTFDLLHQGSLAAGGGGGPGLHWWVLPGEGIPGGRPCLGHTSPGAGVP